jgi:hypothetical protein
MNKLMVRMTFVCALADGEAPAVSVTEPVEISGLKTQEIERVASAQFCADIWDWQVVSSWSESRGAEVVGAWVFAGSDGSVTTVTIAGTEVEPVVG